MKTIFDNVMPDVNWQTPDTGCPIEPLCIGDTFLNEFNVYPSKLIVSNFTRELREIHQGTYIKFDTEQFLHDMAEQYPDMVYVRDDEVDYGDKGIDAESLVRTYNVLIRSIHICMSVRDTLCGTSIYYDNSETANKMLECICDKKYLVMKKPEEETNKFYLITRHQGGYDLIKRSVREMDVDVESNYNDDFAAHDKKIEKFIATDNQSGLIILNGEKGTGKTSYIRHLISKSTRRFVYLTKELSSALTDPEFVSFLTEMSNSVLIIEDCESLVMARKNGNVSTGISNILNMCDGLLSDAFNIKIIATFNVDVSRIDDALLRKGRLICRYEFGKLSANKSNTLLKKLGFSYQTEEPMPLCDIFNYEEDDTLKINNDKKIGFF